jgi:hypothetical protein
VEVAGGQSLVLELVFKDVGKECQTSKATNRWAFAGAVSDVRYWHKHGLVHRTCPLLGVKRTFGQLLLRAKVDHKHGALHRHSPEPFKDIWR